MADAAEVLPRRRAGRFRRTLAAAVAPMRDPFALTGLLIYVVFVLVAVFADQIATHDPTVILRTAAGRLARSIPPGADHLLGTTPLGRDIFSQLVIGTRTALVVGLTAAVVVALIGTIVGLVSGYFGGWIDSVLMGLANIALGIPFLPFVILLAGFLGPRTSNVIVGIALLLWPNTARVIRAQVLSVRERAFVEAARVTGASTSRIMFIHVAPNILPLSFLYGSIAVGWAIVTEASISFLGLGPSPKKVALFEGLLGWGGFTWVEGVSWGSMLQDAYASQALSRGDYHWFVPPGICIVLVVVAGFFISRGYEEILFPKLKD